MALLTPHEALVALRDGIDTEDVHCPPVPIGSSWRYIVDMMLRDEEKETLP